MTRKNQLLEEHLKRIIAEEVKRAMLEENFKAKMAGLQDKIMDWLTGMFSKKLSQPELIKAGQNIESQFGPNPSFQAVFNQLKGLNESNLNEVTIELSQEGIADALVATINKVAGTNLKAFGGLFVPVVAKILSGSGLSTIGEDFKLWVVTFLSSMAIVALAKIYSKLRS